MEEVLVTGRGTKVWIIEISRVKQRNAVDGKTARQLYEKFLEFEADAVSCVAILHGKHGTFCAGADLMEMNNPIETNINEIGPMGISRLRLSKPVIAAIEGFAVAGGLELALWCDIRVAAEDSTFGVFCRRWGVPLIDGGTVRLPRLIGQSRASDMIITGRAVSAKEAFSWGLVNRLSPKNEALRTALKLAEDISELPQNCLRNDLRSSIDQWSLPERSALANEFSLGLSSLRAEAGKGASKFRDGAGRGGSKI